MLYLDEGAKETWETFIIISEGRHREDQRGHMGRGDAVPNAQSAEHRNAGCVSMSSSDMHGDDVGEEGTACAWDRGYMGFWAWLLLGGAQMAGWSCWCWSDNLVRLVEENLVLLLGLDESLLEQVGVCGHVSMCALHSRPCSI